MSMNISQRFSASSYSTGLNDLAWGKQPEAKSATAGTATAARATEQSGVMDPNAGLKAEMRQTFKDQFGAMASDKAAFHDKMKTIYGEGYDSAKAEGFRQKALAGDYDWLPPIRFAKSEELNGANGCYNAEEGVVYINEELKNDPKLAARTYVEEAGHHLDTKLNRGDAAGDEGELFRRIMGGEKLSQSQIAEVKNENDKGTVTINGKTMEVEFWNPFKAVGDAVSGAAKAVGNAVSGATKAVGNAVSGAANAVGNAVGTAAKAVGNAVSGAAKAVGEAAKGVANGVAEVGKGIFGGIALFGQGIFEGIGGFASNLAEGKVGEAFKSLVRGADKAILRSTQRVANGFINGAEQTLLGATNLLGPLGKPAREVIQRGSDMVRTAWNTGFEVARDVFRALPETAITFGEGMADAAGWALKGEWGKAAESFGLAFANSGARLVGGVVDSGARILQGAADIVQVGLGLAPPSRGLNDDEIALLKEVYGDSIDYESVRIKFGGPLNADINGRARVIGNTIYMPSSDANQPLFTTDAAGNKTLTTFGETLFHESAHVWQGQNGGGDYIHKALWGQIAGDGYDYEKAIGEGKSFAEMNPEQQGDYLSEKLAPVLMNAGDAEANMRAAGWNESDIAYALDALAHVNNGSGTPGNMVYAESPWGANA
ncbi:MAG: hypothetical protein ACAI43_14990 [Phycisphaerae bacterium]